MGIFRFFVCLFFLLLSSVSLISNSTVAPDVESPQLESWEVSPTTINVDYAAATVTVIFRVTDSSGVESPLITASHSSGQSTGFAAISRISGDEYDGIWEAEISIPAGAAPGEWNVSLFPLRDTLGNSGSFGPSFGYQSFFNVESTAEAPDVESPQLESWEVSPTTINVDYAAATVTVIFRVTDSSGVESPLITASHSSGQSTGFAAISRISGDEYDGIWEAEISIPAGAAPGEWNVSLFPLRDTLGNSGSFGPSFGYQSFFNVESTAEAPDVESPEDPVLGDQSNSIATWDFDEDGTADALTDGLVLLRYLFGLSGAPLTSNAIATSSSLSASEVEANVVESTTSLFADIDGNGEVDALTDGLVLIRYLFGLRGDPLIASVVGGGADRTTVADIEAYIENNIPGQISADSDNDGVADDLDAFPLNASESIDTDLDGIGNNSDTDDDNDGVADDLDAFPFNSSESIDTDLDGIGNNADTDDDNDAVADSNDLFPLDASEWSDSDGDGVGDNADVFPNDDSETTDSDGDGVGDNTDDLNTELFNFTIPSSSGVFINGVAQRNSTFSTQITNNTGKDLILSRVEFYGDSNLAAIGSGVDLIDNGVHLAGQVLYVTFTVGIYGALLPITVSYSYEFDGVNFVKTFTVYE